MVVALFTFLWEGGGGSDGCGLGVWGGLAEQRRPSDC